MPTPRANRADGHDDCQGEQLAEHQPPALSAICPSSRPDGGRQGGAERERDAHEVGSWNAERPCREPPDLALAEPGDAEMPVARKPEKVPRHGEEEEHREQVCLSLPGAAVELRHVQKEQEACGQTAVVS